MAFTKPGDVLASNSGSVILTINGKNKKVAELKEFEAKLEGNVEEVNLLGRRQKGHKMTSVEGTGSMTLYHVSSDFLKMYTEWLNGGPYPTISLTVTTEDSGTSAKKQVVQLTGVVLEAATIASMSADDGLLEQEVDFKFDGQEIIQAFNN